MMERNTRLIVSFIVALTAGLVGVAAYNLISSARQRRRLRRQKRDLEVVSSAEEYLLHHEKLLEELRDIKILGLDCEWVMAESSRRPVSMLQLSSQTGFCLLIRIHLLERIPQELRDLLADRSIFKCGVGIISDASYLRKDYQLILEGCVDLRHVYMRSMRTKLEMKLSLSGLAGSLLGVKMDKNPRVRCSDWEATTLSQNQIDYAALDALVAADILTHLVLHKMSPSESSVAQFNKKLLSMVQGIVDVNFKEKHVKRNRKQPSGDASPQVKVKPSNAYKMRKGPLYENAQLRAPDGQLLCTCSVGKARWYVEKGIGEHAGDDPLTVRLLFEPSGRPESSNEYYTLDKSNICVVCGAEDSHIRKHIVPKEYRKFFPTCMKEHRSHDILLLCISCHRRSGLYDSVLRARFADQCDAPIDALDARFTVDRELDNIRSCARALLKSRDRIPPERVEALEKTLREFYHVDSVTEDLIETAAEVRPMTENDSYVPHGIKVVRYVMEHGGLIAFERQWRQHFLDSMNPKFLPEMWTIDHNHEKLHEFDLELQNNAELREEILSSFAENS